MILLRNCRLEDAAFSMAERLRKNVEKHTFLWDGNRIPVTISLGVATLHEEESVPDLMVLRADSALYRAKNEGRNRTCLEVDK